MSARRVELCAQLRRDRTPQREVLQRAGDRQVEIKGPKDGSEYVVYLPDELATLLARHVDHFCWDSEARQTLKRNSTTSPSAIR